MDVITYPSLRNGLLIQTYARLVGLCISQNHSGSAAYIVKYHFSVDQNK